MANSFEDKRLQDEENLGQGLGLGLRQEQGQELGVLMDAHIHLDLYEAEQQSELLQTLADAGVEAVVSVSMHLASCRRNLELARLYPGMVLPAFGYHPEQPIPSESELEELIGWIREHAAEMCAVGEIGLPYYNRLEAESQGQHFELDPYVALLDRFLELAVELDKPVALHAVYEDAELVLDRLDRYGVKKAHFHWFKGSEAALQRMQARGCYVSVTPDIVYEAEIQELARRYPLELLLVETDGPWPFEGPFAGQPTHPAMMHRSVETLAVLKGLPVELVREQVRANARRLYGR